jgi:hypothetical protein
MSEIWTLDDDGAGMSNQMIPEYAIQIVVGIDRETGQRRLETVVVGGDEGVDIVGGGVPRRLIFTEPDGTQKVGIWTEYPDGLLPRPGEMTATVSPTMMTVLGAIELGRMQLLSRAHDPAQRARDE